MHAPVRILIVDDSALYRQTIRNVLRDVEGTRVVGMAKNGREALEKIEECEPDLLTLDVQMPDLNGIQVLHELKRLRCPVAAIMVSSFTAHGASVTTEALLEGAFDFILKPSGPDNTLNRRQLQQSLIEKISAFRETRRFRYGQATSPAQEHECESAPAPMTRCRAIVIGTSTGGPEALKSVLPKLPPDFPIPVFVVQHMPPVYTSSLARRLDASCPISVIEGSEGLVATGGMAVLAPGGRHMGLSCDGRRLRVTISDDPPEHAVRPSVDYLLRSATQQLQGELLAVILTGMGRDGLAGCQMLKQAGGSVMAQSSRNCVVFGMPKAVIDACLADRVLPLESIAAAIVRHVKDSCREAREVR